MIYGNADAVKKLQHAYRYLDAKRSLDVDEMLDDFNAMRIILALKTLVESVNKNAR